jgi:protein-tyrosine phosphatase
MIDLHCHLLPGLDDGPPELATSVRLARALRNSGVTAVAATPHVRGGYPTTADDVARGVALVREELERQGVALTVLPGAELGYDELDRPVDELARFGLGGNPRLLLVETPYSGLPVDFGLRLLRLRAAGLTPVLAHPERNPVVRRDPELLENLVASGVVVQLTAASLAAAPASASRATALELLGRGLAHVVAGDAHGPEGRALGPAVVEAALGEELCAWLTRDVPRALLEDRPLPERPALAPGRFGRLRSLLR